ncbi:MAG: hypothetical protein JWO75_482 [Actinomycetia bacterium]|nr:hypothetical protein [Actinomycetes bacterium]
MSDDATRALSSSDPEPPVGTIVQDGAGGLRWINTGRRLHWIALDDDYDDPESWTKIAGNYGPVTVIEWGGEQ